MYSPAATADRYSQKANNMNLKLTIIITAVFVVLLFFYKLHKYPQLQIIPSKYMYIQAKKCKCGPVAKWLRRWTCDWRSQVQS